MTDDEIDYKIRQLEEEADLDKRIKELENKDNVERYGGQVIDEPAGLSGRAEMKMFGTTPKSKLEYYQKLNPNMDVILDKDGGILARQKGTSDWYKEDPSGWHGFKEFGRDVLDLGYDVPAAFVSGGAQGAAGAVNPALGVVAGAATSLAAEKLRKAIGGMLYGQDQDSGDLKSEAINVGSSLLGGAAGTAAFGTGSTKAQIARALSNPNAVRKLLEKSSRTFVPAGAQFTKDQLAEAEKQLINSIGQRGLISYGASKMFPALFGTTPEFIEQAQSKVSPNIVSKLISGGAALDPEKNYSQRQLSNALRMQGKDTLLPEMALEDVNKALKANKKSLSSRYEYHEGRITEVAHPEDFAGPIRDRIDALRSNPSESSQAAAYNLEKIYDSVLKTPVDKEGNLAGPETWGVQSLKDAAQRLDALAGGFKTQQQLLGVSPLTKQDNKALYDSSRMIKDWIKERMSDKKLPSDFAEQQRYTKELSKYFGTPASSASTISNAANESGKQRYVMNLLKDADAKYGTSTEELAKIAQTGKKFGSPALTQVGSGGTTSTTKTLRAENALAGVGSIAGRAVNEVSGATAGSALGRMLGGATFTDAVLNKILGVDQYLKDSKVLSPITGVVGNSAVKQTMRGAIPWSLISNEEYQK